MTATNITLTSLFISLTALGACTRTDDGAATQVGPNIAVPAHTEVDRKAAISASIAPGLAPAERGQYLVTVGGCNDCHTPMKMTAQGPAPDADRLLSGHPEQAHLPPPPALSGPWMATIGGPGTAYSGPWGISYTANLTPDKETGLGAWTADTFIATMRTARHMGSGRPILPPMPVQNLGQMTDEDLKAIFAYLQTIPAISNHVPQPVPPSTAGAPAPSPDEHAELAPSAPSRG